MKKLLITILFLASLAYAAVDLTQLIIAIPKTFYDNNPAKVRKVVRAVWGDEVTAGWADSGWITMWRNGDSNQVWLLYVVSMHQIKDIATDEKIGLWKSWLDNNPQVRVKRSQDWLADAKREGLDYPPNEVSTDIK